MTAHEFGHNWGSEHDPDSSECSPSASQGGSYLMYTYSVSGYDVNNKKFSPCSLRFIRKVRRKNGVIDTRGDFGSMVELSNRFNNLFIPKHEVGENVSTTINLTRV